MRAGLAFLALVQAGVGGWILLAPRSFYANPWVHLHLPYNGHLLLDYGAMNLAMAVLLALAVRRRSLAVPALCVYLVHSSLHLVIHTGYLEHLSTGESVAVLAALGVPVLLPALLLVGARRASTRTVREFR